MYKGIVAMSASALLAAALFVPTVSAAEASFGVENAAQINGAANEDQVCSTDSAGDFNGDGIPDVVVGACLADMNGRNNSGSVYVVYGKPGGLSTNAAVDLQRLNTNGKTDGVRIDGVSGHPNCRQDSTKDGPYWDIGKAHHIYEGSNADLCPETGFSVAGAGDFNGDNFDDIVIGARGVDLRRNDDERYWRSTDQGVAYIIYGNRQLPKTIDLASLPPAFGMSILGDDDDDYYGEGAGSETRGDELGSSVDGAGDVNGDGLDDVVIGAPNSDHGAEDGRHDAGAAYIVYGNAYGATSFDTRFHDPNQMAMIVGERGAYWNRGNELGRSVSKAGDFNNDGLSDVILGAPGRDTNSYYWDPGCAGAQVSPGEPFAGTWIGCGKEMGSAYVVLGRPKEQWANYMNLENNKQGVHQFWGKRADDRLGTSVSEAGDVNGDGIADVTMGAPREDTNAGGDAGAAYVWFGYNSKSKVPPNGRELDRGFKIMGSPSAKAELGQAVSSVGDLNGDGKAEVAVALPYESRGGGLLGGADAGSVAVIYGKNGEEQVDTRTLADNGFWIDGAMGCPLSLCGPGGPRQLSIVGSNFDIGAPADELGAGGLIASNDGDVKLDNGALHNVAAAGDMNGDGTVDILTGSHLAGTLKRSANGAAYIVYGSVLAYQNEYALKVGQDTAIVPTKFQSATRTPTFEVDPPLPAGLSIGLGAKPGTISGTPQKAAPSTKYTVTMDDPQGPIRASFTLKVEDDGASNLPTDLSEQSADSGSGGTGDSSLTTDGTGTTTTGKNRKRCKAVLGKPSKSASKLLRNKFRVRLTGPREVRVSKLTQGGLFSLVSTKGRSRKLKRVIKKVTFSVKPAARGGKSRKVGVDRRSPYTVNLARSLKPGKYMLTAKVQLRGSKRTKTLRIAFKVVPKC